MSSPVRPGLVGFVTEARDALVGLVCRATGSRSEGHVFVSGSTMRCQSDGPAGGNRAAVVCVAGRRRSQLCNGKWWFGAAMGALLARASVQIKKWHHNDRRERLAQREAWAFSAQMAVVASTALISVL